VAIAGTPHRHPGAAPPAEPIPPGTDPEGKFSRLTGFLRTVFVIILVAVFFWYVSVYGYTWF